MSHKVEFSFRTEYDETDSSFTHAFFTFFKTMNDINVRLVSSIQLVLSVTQLNFITICCMAVILSGLEVTLSSLRHMSLEK